MPYSARKTLALGVDLLRYGVEQFSLAIHAASVFLSTLVIRV
jgi:hypothetical protein